MDPTHPFPDDFWTNTTNPYEWEDIGDFESEDMMNKPHREAGKITYLMFLFVLSLTVNIILLVQQYRNRLDRSAMRFMLINLAIVNIFSSIFLMFFCAVLLGVGVWYAGDFLCKMFMFLAGMDAFLRTFACTGLLMAYIVEQATRLNGRTIGLFFILPVWIFAVILCLPRMAFNGTINHFDKSYCHIKHTKWSHIMMGLNLLSTVIIGYIFPLIISAVLCCVYCVVGKSSSDNDLEAAKASYNTTTAENNTSDATITIDGENEIKNGSVQEYNQDTIEITPSTATSPAMARRSDTNIQPRSLLPLILGVICFVMHTPVIICGILGVVISGMFNLVLWMYLLSVTSVFITGIIPIIWYMQIEIPSVAGFSFKRFI